MIYTGAGHMNALNKYGEVNWTKSEMIPLSDDEALALMDSHHCAVAAMKAELS